MTDVAADLPFTVQHPLFAALLLNNHTLCRAFAAVLPPETVIRDWPDLTEALAEDDRLDRLVDGFLGNKSERFMLACVLMKADHAARADTLMPRAFTTWGGLDARNKAMALDMLEGVDEMDDAFDGPRA